MTFDLKWLQWLHQRLIEKREERGSVVLDQDNDDRQVYRCCEGTRWFVAWCCRTFFHISAYWPTLQQCRSRIYVSVIRRKWIRSKRKPSRALNCKKARRTRAQTMSFICEKRIPPPRLPPSIRCIIYLFLPLYLSIHLSVRLPLTDHFYADATISSSLFLIFLLFTCIPIPLVAPRYRFHAFVTREWFHEHCIGSIFVDKKREFSKKRYSAGDYETICERQDGISYRLY